MSDDDGDSPAKLRQTKAKSKTRPPGRPRRSRREKEPDVWPSPLALRTVFDPEEGTLGPIFELSADAARALAKLRQYAAELPMLPTWCYERERTFDFRFGRMSKPDRLMDAELDFAAGLDRGTNEGRLLAIVSRAYARATEAERTYKAMRARVAPIATFRADLVAALRLIEPTFEHGPTNFTREHVWLSDGFRLPAFLQQWGNQIGQADELRQAWAEKVPAALAILAELAFSIRESFEPYGWRDVIDFPRHPLRGTTERIGADGKPEIVDAEGKTLHDYIRERILYFAYEKPLGARETEKLSRVDSDLYQQLKNEGTLPDYFSTKGQPEKVRQNHFIGRVAEMLALSYGMPVTISPYRRPFDVDDGLAIAPLLEAAIGVVGLNLKQAQFENVLRNIRSDQLEAINRLAASSQALIKKFGTNDAPLPRYQDLFTFQEELRLQMQTIPADAEAAYAPFKGEWPIEAAKT